MTARSEIARAFHQEVEAAVSSRLITHRVMLSDIEGHENPKVSIHDGEREIYYAAVRFCPTIIVVDCYRLNRRYQVTFDYATPWVDEILGLLNRHMNREIPTEEYI